jgi:PilZ domain-containing protein
LLNELVKRFSGHPAERRSAERVRRKYTIAWLRGSELVPAAGIEISERGLLFASRTSPQGKQVDVALDLAGRRVRARMTIVRKDVVPRDGVNWTLVATEFQGIAADDWDAVVRFCRAEPEPVNRAAGELAALAEGEDNAYRLLPIKVQQRVVDVLARAGRLAPWDPAKSPLLRMSYTGQTRAGGHRLTVHSRLPTPAEVLFFDSIVTVDDAGNVVLDR